MEKQAEKHILEWATDPFDQYMPRMFITQEGALGIGANGQVMVMPLEAWVRLAANTQVCKKCGCTEFDPCEEGCWWVTEDLCSACAGEGA